MTLLNRLDTNAPRTSYTKYWGAIAVVGLPLGWSLMNFESGKAAMVATIPIIAGLVGYVLSIRSVYARKRHKRGLALDERQTALFYRANSYAFRATAILLLLGLLYGMMAGRAETTLWFPHSRDQWWHLLLPMALVLPILPTVIAEWLDPVPEDDAEA